MKKKETYKRILAALSSITMIPSLCACNEKNESQIFNTEKGTRNLKDYDKFLNENNIETKKCYAEVQGNNVFVFEKKDSKHIVNETDTFESLQELYPITKEELLSINYKEKDYELKVGDELKVYYYEMHAFTLDELDNSSEYIYHYITEGETLSQIAAYYGVTLEEIKEANKIEDINMIQAYTSIKIPKKQKEKELSK